MRYDPRASWLYGIPTATLQSMLSQAQSAMLQLKLGAKPKALNYAQGDGAKGVVMIEATEQGLTTFIAELNAQLGNIQRPRRALRVDF